ncbi:GNAT family N-acetyltransferase [Marivirga salinae]|uniref:GNAT family N-acetyltransferase n=1 Tax=Marivirga salinarum TaxID=3059078 RepID=A0AA49GCG4_9BACT|nr:GNAT family N-acetyltransferase [Marivirga sp. BDSF4-3]WKK77123.1 GNAT family N-acetyltransferase [Marivirga sp. BDSF4-3]
MNNLSIRQATFQDIADLQKISKKTFFETYAAGNTEEDMLQYLDVEFATEKLKVELNNKNSKFYFAILMGEIIGYIKINLGESQTESMAGKSLEIQRIYVLKEFQGQKIGKALYQKAAETAKQNELDYLWLGVWEENPKAIQFYEKIGFEAFDKHVFQLGSDAQTDIMMKLQLN